MTVVIMSVFFEKPEWNFPNSHSKFKDFILKNPFFVIVFYVDSNKNNPLRFGF